MPEEEKKKESPVSTEPMVDIDTSGPEVDVTLEETKDEAVVDTAPETKTQEVVEEKKETEKKEDEKLEDYSKGVQARIAKLTRKMREAERREAAALQYAESLEKKRKLDLDKFNIKRISIEHYHLKKNEKRNLLKHLSNKGYSYSGFGYDLNNLDYLFVKKKIPWNQMLSKLLTNVRFKKLKYFNFFIIKD